MTTLIPDHAVTENPCPECKGKKGFYDTTYNRAGGDWTECHQCYGTGKNITRKFAKAAVAAALSPDREPDRFNLEMTNRSCGDDSSLLYNRCLAMAPSVSEIPMANIFSIPLVIAADPDHEGEAFSLFTDATGAINAEIVGKICDREVAERICNWWNASIRTDREPVGKDEGEGEAERLAKELDELAKWAWDKYGLYGPAGDLNAAATFIRALHSRNKAMQEALEPFAKVVDQRVICEPVPIAAKPFEC